MPTSDPDVAIAIITTTNEPKMVMDCVDSLLKSLSDRLRVDIWVVDNATASNNGELIKRTYPSVNVVRNDQKRGFAYNNNMVWARTKSSRYFLILNDDTIIHENFIESLVKVADEHPEGGFFGPKILNWDLTLQRSAYLLPSPVRNLLEALGLHRLFARAAFFDDFRNWDCNDFRPVPFLIGAALLARQEMLSQIGGLDEDFFAYGEDTDWCKRAVDAGWKIYLVPSATMVHLGGQSTLDVPTAKHVEFLRGHYRYIRKHHGAIGVMVYRIGEFLKHSSRWVAHSIRGNRASATLHKEGLLFSAGMLNAKGLKELAAEQQSAPSVLS